MSVAGWLWLRGVRLAAARVGALPRERRRRQPLEFDVGLLLDLAPAAASDALADTLDWRDLYATIEARALSRHWSLVEALAVDVARHLLEAPGVEAVICEVRKPESLPTGAAAVRVELRAAGRGEA